MEEVQRKYPIDALKSFLSEIPLFPLLAEALLTIPPEFASQVGGPLVVLQQAASGVVSLGEERLRDFLECMLAMLGGSVEDVPEDVLGQSEIQWDILQAFMTSLASNFPELSTPIRERQLSIRFVCEDGDKQLLESLQSMTLPWPYMLRIAVGYTNGKEDAARALSILPKRFTVCLTCRKCWTKSMLWDGDHQCSQSRPEACIRYRRYHLNLICDTGLHSYYVRDDAPHGLNSVMEERDAAFRRITMHCETLAENDQLLTWLQRLADALKSGTHRGAIVRLFKVLQWLKNTPRDMRRRNPVTQSLNAIPLWALFDDYARNVYGTSLEEETMRSLCQRPPKSFLLTEDAMLARQVDGQSAFLARLVKGASEAAGLVAEWHVSGLQGIIATQFSSAISRKSSVNSQSKQPNGKQNFALDLLPLIVSTCIDVMYWTYWKRGSAIAFLLTMFSIVLKAVFLLGFIKSAMRLSETVLIAAVILSILWSVPLLWIAFDLKDSMDSLICFCTALWMPLMMSSRWFILSAC